MLLQEGDSAGSSGDNNASSSKMISFDFENGDPFGPHLPASIDDEDYVEYPLDSLADFPSNAEEEERVSMSFFVTLTVLPRLKLLTCPNVSFVQKLRCLWKQY